jgi:hypothetical protein
MSLRARLPILGLLLALGVSIAVVAYSMYGALSLTPIPSGRMSVLSFI